MFAIKTLCLEYRKLRLTTCCFWLHKRPDFPLEAFFYPTYLSLRHSRDPPTSFSSSFCTSNSTNTMKPNEPRITFLSLPMEIRNHIYRSALCRRDQFCARPFESRKLQKLAPIAFNCEGVPVAISLLRTCKQIYLEAIPIFFGGNTFLCDLPEENLKWLDKIGSRNVKYLKRLRIFVSAVFSTTKTFFSDGSGVHWYRLLERFSRDATGLRYIFVYWDADTFSSIHHGAGRDLRFVRTLATIKGLDELVIKGFFAKPWPKYLKGKVGKLVCDQEGQEDKSLRYYQRGIENLTP